MDKDEFEKYLKERYHNQIEWYDKKSLYNQKWYKRFQLGLIIFSALTPVLIAIDLCMSNYPLLKWVPIIASIIVAVLVSSLSTFKFQENWINYRTTCETLKKEIYFYNSGAGDYANTNDKECLFCERVESLTSRENTLWLITHKEKDSKKIGV